MKVRAIWNGPESLSPKYGRLIAGKEYQVDEADMASSSFAPVPEEKPEVKVSKKEVD